MKNYFILILLTFYSSFAFSQNTNSIDQQHVTAWLADNHDKYFQKYKLSCEAAVVRMVCNILGINDLTEDRILQMMLTHKSDPNKGLVIQHIDGSNLNRNGSINWLNYGAHAPVLKQLLDKILSKYRQNQSYKIIRIKLNDFQLKKYFTNNQNCLGAIVWVAANHEFNPPPVNKHGQVFGEHVQFVAPVLTADDKFQVFDVWPHKNQPFRISQLLNRNLFDYELLLIEKNVSQSGLEEKDSYYLQIGVFSSWSNAEKVIKIMKDNGYTVCVYKKNTNNSVVYKLRLGPYSDRTEIETIKNTIIINFSINDCFMVKSETDGDKAN